MVAKKWLEKLINQNKKIRNTFTVRVEGKKVDQEGSFRFQVLSLYRT